MEGINGDSSLGSSSMSFGEEEVNPYAPIARQILRENNIIVTPEKLGKGTYGTVYKGWAKERAVAVKICDYLDSFRIGSGEGVALNLPKKQGLQRTHAIVLYDQWNETYHFVDRTNVGQFSTDQYQVVATVTSERLRDLEGLSLTREQFIELARQLVQSIHALIQLGIGHCDLHSGNVFIADPKNGQSYRFKVADFGAAFHLTSAPNIDWTHLSDLLYEVIDNSKENVSWNDSEIRSFLDTLDQQNDDAIINHPLIRDKNG
ncbi:MAG: protein kinase family protein [Chlamydiales bacterium]|nr:protein kinase family protein [Chlamydiales bacterium]